MVIISTVHSIRYRNLQNGEKKQRIIKHTKSNT